MSAQAVVNGEREGRKTGTASEALRKAFAERTRTLKYQQ